MQALSFYLQYADMQRYRHLKQMFENVLLLQSLNFKLHYDY